MEVACTGAVGLVRTAAAARCQEVERQNGIKW